MSRKTELAALGGLLILITAFFADLLIGHNALFVRDFARSYVPERAVLHDLLRATPLPMWNPRYGAGQPLAANPNYELFYPPQWLALLPSVPYAVSIEVVLHFLLAATGMFFLLRSLGLRLEAVVFGSFALTLGGLMMSLASLLPYLFILAWWPWLALFTWRYLETCRPRDFTLAALVLGLILLIGEPALILESGMMIAGLAVARRRWRGVAIAGAICAVALAVGSVQIVPAIDLMRDSPRGASLSYAAVGQWSLAPLRPLELGFPDVFTRFTPDAYFVWYSDEPVGQPWVFNFYLGLMGASLAVAGFVRRLPGWKWIASAVLLAYALALGRHTPLLPFLYRHGVNFIRYPEKFFIGGCFALVVFSAIAADRFIVDRNFRWVTFIVAILFSAIAIGITVHAYAIRLPLFVEQRAGALTMLVFSVVLSVILAFRERPRIAMPLLALFVIADLGSRTVGWAPRVGREVYDAPPITAHLQPHGRIYNDADMLLLAGAVTDPALLPDQRALRERNGMWPEMQAIWGFDSVLELDATRTMLNPTVEFSRIFRSARLAGRSDLFPMLAKLAGVSDVLAIRDLADVDDPVRVVPLSASRWYFADRLLATPAIRNATSGSGAPAFVDQPFAPAAGRILAAHQGVNTMDFDVEAAGKALLVIAVTPHRYWRATIDDSPASLIAANVGFQAIAVPAGRHHIEMRYRNPLVIAFGIVSLVSVAVLVAVALRSTAPRPRSPH